MQQESLNELNELDVEIVSLERQRESLERQELQELQREIRKLQSEIRNQQNEIRKQKIETHQQQIKIRKQQSEIIGKLKQNAQSPMGVALTHVLLSLNRESTRLNLRDFPEMLPNICLAGINFDFSEIKEKARDLSQLNLNDADLRAADLFFVNLHGTNLSKADLSNADLSKANLSKANLSNANLSNADLSNADLSNADLSKANLSKANLSKANLSNADLSNADLLDANLLSTDLRRSFFAWMKLQESRSLFNAKISINNFSRYIYPYWKQTDSQRWGNLTEPEQKEAMQTFCNETGMIIFDDDGNVVAKRQS